MAESKIRSVLLVWIFQMTLIYENFLDSYANQDHIRDQGLNEVEELSKSDVIWSYEKYQLIEHVVLRKVLSEE